MHTRLLEGVARLIILLLAVAGLAPAGGQVYETNNVMVHTHSGSGFSGLIDGVGQQTMFNSPSAVVSDSSGNLFVLDSASSRIRRITSDGVVSTFAGGGASQPPGHGTNVSLGNGSVMAIDRSGTLWLVGFFVGKTHLVKVRNDGFVSNATVLTANAVGSPSGLCTDSQNNVYISTWTGNQIYRYRTNGTLEVFAGSGNSGGVDGNGVFSSFSHPRALSTDAADNIYVWEVIFQRLRRINQNRDVVTIALGNSSTSMDGFGTNATLVDVSGMCVDRMGNVLFACGGSIRKMTADTNITTVAGNFIQTGYANGQGHIARFTYASGICESGGMLFVADQFDHRIRSISFDAPEQQVSPGMLELNTYPGLKITGTIGRTYRIEATKDGISWEPVETLLLRQNPFLWVDPLPATGVKMYRAFLLP